MNYDLWFWMGCYFSLGVALVLLGRLLVKLFHKDQRSDFVKGALAALEADKTPQEKRRDFFKSVATGSLVFVVWPVAFAVLVNELRGGTASSYTKEDEPKFTCEMKDLLEIVNPNEVEVASKIIDPKNRVPDLPFGHLNRGWKRLKWKMRPGDVMWSFRTSGYQPSNSEGYKGPQYSAPQNVVFGYAIVRSKKIVAEFLTQWD